MPTCIHALEKEGARLEKQAKKKAKAKEGDGWTPSSITAISERDKMHIRPLPMHVESLINYFATVWNGKERETEEAVGKILADALGETKAVKEGEKAFTALPYCRVCDLVYNNIDAFYEHIQSDNHALLKEDDSVPLFEDVGEGVELTRNQVIAREFMGPVLLMEDVQDEKETERAEKSDSKEDESKKEEKKTKKKTGTLTDAQMSSLSAKDIVEHRLLQRPCAVCSRIWKEYGGLISGTTDLSTEFAFRSHPVHPCVALLNVTLECYKNNLEIESDEASRSTSTRPVKYPSREQLKELASHLDQEIPLTLELGDRHCYACMENYQVAMHCRAEEIRMIYDRFMEGCKKRDEEGRRFYCDMCSVVLPSSRHFRLHLLSEGHDKKMGKAPVRQSALYNPLCQLICFIEADSLLPRMKKIVKKEEKKKELSKKEKGEEDSKKEQKMKRGEERNKKEMKKVKGEKKKEDPKMKKERKRMELTIRYEMDPNLGYSEDKRGFLVYRMCPKPKTADGNEKVIKVNRRERTESEKAADEIVNQV
ncbi:hypothetical protein PMAYCL1PPCAC_28712 [Pristionchus mayeri]|uniref:C2H2-type domain-containing protein n=1 Tax=Pristionchus mayeri TaxID=1317129 RepID=A0AAN5D9I5_9BILA|nr:hypothetical protein PMAYCL1PPCAC_28712 [Pristionchus mayeri]